MKSSIVFVSDPKTAKTVTKKVQAQPDGWTTPPLGLDLLCAAASCTRAQNFVQDAGLIGQGGLSTGRLFLKKRHQNTRRRANAPADLEPPKGFELGLG